ncbi:hypothetical protein KGY71_02555 [Candidatus Bipolaricaulota bacterium]|nr:hypothetical protein [Candidatus Bipolaricaulota bacterium]MBS3792719.1 hypothetical protein [Candidatus Bipolaricaulota bacterium]
MPKYDFKQGLSWEEFREKAIDQNLEREIREIEELGPAGDISRIWNQLVSLEDIAEINELNQLLEEQASLGGWVDGLLPPPFEAIDDSVLKNDVSSYTRVMLKLFRKRNENISAIKELREYPLEFNGDQLLESLNNPDGDDLPSHWNVDLAASPLKMTIDLFDGDVSSSGPERIAGLEANGEMLSHRKSLGYLPDPVTGEAELARFLSKAKSKDPLDTIWKFLSPMIFFDLSDIYLNIEDYRDMISQLKESWELVEREVFQKIYPHIKSQSVGVDETFALTIGYGIRGWVTDKMFGINIEYVKDDFNALLGTLAHELFHRIQPRLLPENKPESEEVRRLEELTQSSMDSERDEKFYDILAYIILEGTGEFIRHKFGSMPNRDEMEAKARNGVDILAKCNRKIYSSGDLESAEKLLMEGLKSNGPFYSLGEFMTGELIDRDSEDVIGRSLGIGVLGLFHNYFDLPDKTISFPKIVRDSVGKLTEKV